MLGRGAPGCWAVCRAMASIACCAWSPAARPLRHFQLQAPTPAPPAADLDAAFLAKWLHLDKEVAAKILLKHTPVEQSREQRAQGRATDVGPLRRKRTWCAGGAGCLPPPEPAMPVAAKLGRRVATCTANKQRCSPCPPDCRLAGPASLDASFLSSWLHLDTGAAAKLASEGKAAAAARRELLAGAASTNTFGSTVLPGAYPAPPPPTVDKSCATGESPRPASCFALRFQRHQCHVHSPPPPHHAAASHSPQLTGTEVCIGAVLTCPLGRPTPLCTPVQTRASRTPSARPPRAASCAAPTPSATTPTPPPPPASPAPQAHLPPLVSAAGRPLGRGPGTRQQCCSDPGRILLLSPSFHGPARGPGPHTPPLCFPYPDCPIAQAP